MSQPGTLPSLPRPMSLPATPCCYSYCCCREEQVAYDALKKQMVFYQHTLSAAGLKRGDSFKDPAGLALRGERGEPAGDSGGWLGQAWHGMDIT